MGIFDFIADAGSNLFKGDEPKEEIIKPISVQINEAGVATEHLKVKFNDGTVTLSGYVSNQEQREKAVLVAGNIKGVSSVHDNMILGEPPVEEQQKQEAEAAASAITSEPSFRTYTVKSGDTLGKISQQFYGKASLYNKIFEANTPMLKNPDQIYPGQVLKIPD